MSAAAATSAGYTVVTNRAAMQAFNTETQTRVSGQFGSSYLPYEYDGPGALGGRAVGADQEFHLFTLGDSGSLDGNSGLAMDWEGAIELLGDDWNSGHQDWNPTLRSDATGVYISGLVAVSEPSTLVLLSMGALALLTCARRNGRRTKIDAARGNILPTPGRIGCLA